MKHISHSIQSVALFFAAILFVIAGMVHAGSVSHASQPDANIALDPSDSDDPSLREFLVSNGVDDENADRLQMRFLGGELLEKHDRGPAYRYILDHE